MCILAYLAGENAPYREAGTGNGSGRNTGKRSINFRQSGKPDWITADAMQGSLIVSVCLHAGILGFPVLMCCYRLAVQNERREADIHGKVGNQVNGKEE